MATMTLERRRNDIIRSIRKTTDTNLLDKIASLLNYEAVKEPKVEEKDDTCMTKEEFFAMIDKSMEEYEKGHYHTMLPNESLDDFLARVAQ
ncbi:MAG: hypothetical protein J6M30_04620 [Bacteroidales bacterium]|nr:hypothetical protein [Bacteroidales bacterium]